MDSLLLPYIRDPPPPPQVVRRSLSPRPRAAHLAVVTAPWQVTAPQPASPLEDVASARETAVATHAAPDPAPWSGAARLVPIRLTAPCGSPFPCARRGRAPCPAGPCRALPCPTEPFRALPGSAGLCPEEEEARIKTAILEALDKPTSKTADEATRRSVKGYGLHAVRLNAVDRVFGGELINIITCDRCRTIVRVAEPFLDLSLPVIDNTASRPTSKKARAVEEEVEERGGRERGEDKVTGSRRRGSSPTLPPAPQSKFQEKKAKKQARQQAKSMRRQQKHQRKLFPMGAETLSGDPDSSTTDTTVTNNIKQEDENDIHVDNESAADAAATADDQDDDDDDDGDADDAADAADEDAAAADEDVSPEDVRISVDEVTKVEEEEEDDEEEEPMKSSSRDTRMRRRKDEALSFGSDEETRLVAVAVHDPVETLAEACDVPPDRASLLGCLLRFTTPEQLAGSNMLLCEHCSQKAGKKGRVYTEGTKRILVSSLPPVLTLHLKRFQQAGFGLQKVNRRVEFEDTLDMAPFCIKPCQVSACSQTKTKIPRYSLYAVVEHSGTMRGGHYTAYVKTRPERPERPAAGPGESGGSGQQQQQQQEGAWFYVSDSHVRAASLEQVLACQAYLLFYERAGQ
ncbi:unnamed protein product [Lampetra fluviatilis]